MRGSYALSALRAEKGLTAESEAEEICKEATSVEVFKKLMIEALGNPLFSEDSHAQVDYTTVLRFLER